LPRLTLILGGARSGKSRHGESLVKAEPGPWTYIATAQALDEEMRARIAVHRARRGEGWRTVEAPVDMPDAVLLAADRPVLVDCLTLWLSNLLLGELDLTEAKDALDDALDWRESPTVLVASEVGLGIVPETPLGRRFRDEAGLLHQRLAARADRVILMVAGLPMAVK
jgi:adenosyl cobinamide kinase/adenosyl cobinamide phosphate guanylyltransferase